MRRLCSLAALAAFGTVSLMGCGGGTTGDGTSDDQVAPAVTVGTPMNSGDSRDRVLAESNAYTVLLSYGPNNADNFTTQHAQRVRTSITL